MTHTTTVLNDFNAGNHRLVQVEVDISSLDAEGVEDFDPESELNLSGVEGGTIIFQPDALKEITFAPADNPLGPAFFVSEIDDTGDGSGGVVDVANNATVSAFHAELRGDGGP